MGDREQMLRGSRMCVVTKRGVSGSIRRAADPGV